MIGRIVIALCILTSSLFGIGFVSGYNFIFPPQISGSGVLAPVFLGEDRLDATIVVYKSDTDIEAYDITSKECSIRSRFLDSHKGLYFFGVDFSDDAKCEDDTVYLSYRGEVVEDSAKVIPFENFETDILTFLDYSSKDLRNFRKSLKKDIKKYGIYANYQGTRVAKYYKYFQRQRKYFQSLREKEIIETILEKREYKYTSPVKGRTISQKFTKIPNSPRPYRAGYTDGIHRGWDIDTDLGENVVALDDGYIVRIVSGFDNATDFDRIQYGLNLTEEQELKNLDILRGNQVWLKTMKGEVVFYSHLGNVNEALFEGKYVSRGTIFGTVGTTGVPGDHYNDYHLHFPIMENPYNKDQAGTYEFTDYMFWDWLTKGMGYSETLEAQKDIFE